MENIKEKIKDWEGIVERDNLLTKKDAELAAYEIALRIVQAVNAGKDELYIETVLEGSNKTLEIDKNIEITAREKELCDCLINIAIENIVRERNDAEWVWQYIEAQKADDVMYLAQLKEELKNSKI